MERLLWNDLLWNVLLWNVLLWNVLLWNDSFRPFSERHFYCVRNRLYSFYLQSISSYSPLLPDNASHTLYQISLPGICQVLKSGTNVFVGTGWKWLMGAWVRQNSCRRRIPIFLSRKYLRKHLYYRGTFYENVFTVAVLYHVQQSTEYKKRTHSTLHPHPPHSKQPLQRILNEHVSHFFT